jgi:hypothetical protein
VTGGEQIEPEEVETAMQFGYVRPDGTTVWAWPHSDGTWTPWDPELGIDAIDTGPETTVADVARHLPPGFRVVSREVRTIYGPRTEHPVDGGVQS